MSLHLDATRVEQSTHLDQNKPANLLHVLSGQIAYSCLSGLILRHFKILKDEKQNEKNKYMDAFIKCYMLALLCDLAVCLLRYSELVDDPFNKTHDLRNHSCLEHKHCWMMHKLKIILVFVFRLQN